MLPLELIVERMSAGRAVVRASTCRACSRASPANITLVDLDAEWQVGESGYESRSANSPWAGETLTVARADDGRRRGGRYRERSFAIGAVA